MALGKKIRTLREQQGLSQEELSALTDNAVSQGAISALEKRDSTTSKHVPALAKALGVPVSQLYDSTEYQLTPDMIAHLKVLQQLPDYAREEVIRDAIKTAELISKATTAANKKTGTGPTKQ
jgi:transcriptional regulator with XRE-family HTH domain